MPTCAHATKGAGTLWLRWMVLLLVVLPAITATAGGGPQNVLIVINDQSIESQEVGMYYRKARGIPERNVCRISVDPYLYNATPTFFQTAIVDRVHQHIVEHGLTNQIDYIVLSKELPSRLNANEGATASFFYGFKNASGNPPCTVPTNTRSAYYKTERGFSHRNAFGGANSYLAMMITAQTLFHALTNIDNGVASDSTMPTGTIYLVAPPADAARNIRYKLFSGLDFESRFWSDFPGIREIFSNTINNRKDVLGYLTGLSSHPEWFWSTNVYTPGAIADHFTSWGGRIPVPGGGQSSLLEWIRAGASASYGTVAEPCAFLEKFPDPMLFYWYYRGFNLAETYWMSVANPYQGLFVGEPLAAPYARPPAVEITNPSSNEWVSGVVTVEVSATTNALGIPPRSIDLYIDDLFIQTLTNRGASAGNILETAIGGVTSSYQVAAGDSLYTAVASLADAINATNVPVEARAYGDRILLLYINYGHVGSGITYSAQTLVGTATVRSVWGRALSSNLLESIYPAREYVSLLGTANSGDTVNCTITLTNSTVVTNTIVAQQDQTSSMLIGLLKDLINSNVLLQATDGVKAVVFTYQPTAEMALEARRPGPEGYSLFVDYQVEQAIPSSGLSTSVSFSSAFNDAEEYVFSDPVRDYRILTARGNLLFWCGQDPLTASWDWDTTALPNGRHTLRAVARDGAATETQGHAFVPVVVSNTAFACLLVSPTNGANFTLGDDVFVSVAATNEAGSVTQVLVYVEGKLSAQLTAAPFVTSWSTLDYGVGEVPMQATAFDGSGNQAVSDPAMVRVLRSPTLDTDGDQIPDSWEQAYFGGLYVYGHTNDPDSDGPNNFDEYIADTIPSDSNSFYSITVDRWSNETVAIMFDSSSSRQYLAEFNDNYITNFSDWQVSTGQYFWGAGGSTNWVDDGTETGAHPSSTVRRIYRMRVRAP